jgi:predicted heme/steroid binding protein
VKVFSVEELSRYNGKDMPAYIAFEGKVFDVSSSFLRKDGRHQVLHTAGVDLTEAMGEAPHGEELLYRLPQVGVLRKQAL